MFDKEDVYQIDKSIMELQSWGNLLSHVESNFFKKYLFKSFEVHTSASVYWIAV